MNYTNFVFSLVMLVLLIVITILLFKKLDAFKPFQISIFLILLTFWFAQAVVSNEVTDVYDPKTVNWEWPLLVGTYRFTQAIVMMPIAIWGKKIKSRKVPLVALGILLVITIVLNVSLNQYAGSDSHWTVYLMMAASGAFASTTGMQNLYWSENYGFKKVFMTTAVMSLLPTLGDYLGKVFIKCPSIDQIEATRWVSLASGILLALAVAYYIFFIKEDKSTIRAANNDYEDDAKVTAFEWGRVAFNSVGIFLAAISFEMIKSTGVSKYFLISTNHADDATITSLVVSAAASLVTIVVSLWLIKRFKSFKLTIYAKIITIISLLFGIILISCDALNMVTWTIFLITSSIGMAIYFSVTFGVMMHFHHHSKLLVLPMWLTVRASGMFIGQLIGNEWMVLADDKSSALLYVFVTSLCIALIGMAWTMYRYYNNAYLLYNLVDRYEYEKARRKMLREKRIREAKEKEIIEKIISKDESIVEAVLEEKRDVGLDEKL